MKSPKKTGSKKDFIEVRPDRSCSYLNLLVQLFGLMLRISYSLESKMCFLTDFRLRETSDFSPG